MRNQEWARCRYLGNGFEDLVNLLFKVHVQQPVRLVQHQMLQQLKTETLQLEICTLQQVAAKHGLPAT